MLRWLAALTLWLCVVVHNSPAFAQLDSASQPSQTSPSATDHFALGIAALETGNFQAAYDHLLAEYRAAPSYRTAAVLGQAAGELGKHAEAASLLASSLQAMPNDIGFEARKPIQDYLEQMQHHVTTIEVVVSPVEASARMEVELDGKPVAVDVDLFLEPGPHVLSVRAPGYSPVQIQLLATPGQSKRKLVHLSRLASPSRARHREPLRESDSPQTSSYAWRLPTAIISGGLALAGAGLGGSFVYQVYDADSRITDAEGRLPPPTSNPCAPDGRVPDACRDLSSLVSRRTSNVNAARVTLFTAGALAVASAALWVWQLSDDASMNATLLPNGVVVGYEF